MDSGLGRACGEQLCWDTSVGDGHFESSPGSELNFHGRIFNFQNLVPLFSFVFPFRAGHAPVTSLPDSLALLSDLLFPLPLLSDLLFLIYKAVLWNFCFLLKIDQLCHYVFIVSTKFPKVISWDCRVQRAGRWHRVSGSCCDAF